MASAHRLVRPSRTLLITLLAAAALVVGSATTGQAAPTPSAADAARQVATLEVKMEKATEDYDTARVELGRSQARAVKLAAQTKAALRQVETFGAQVADFAAAAYRGGKISQFTSLLDSGSPQNFLDQIATLDHLSRSQRQQLQQLIRAQKTLTAQKRELSAELASQKKTEATLKARKASIEKDLAKWTGLAAQARSRATRSTTRVAQQSSPSYTGPATGRAAVAVRTAYGRLGRPYSWGAAGPNAFDCSGLTMYSWAAAGVSLPHSSRMQYSSGPHVARSNLQPGDLVFFGSPIHHVGIYIGGGQMIHAPVPGDVVRISPLLSDYVGAVRP